MYSSPFKALTAGSRHVRGVNVLTMDGSVHFVRDSIDARVWSALGTRRGGDLVDSSVFP